MKKNLARIVMLSDMAAEKDFANLAKHISVSVRKNADENGNDNQLGLHRLSCALKRACAD